MTTEPIYLFPTSVIKRSYDKPFLNEFEYLRTRIDYRDGSDHAFSTSINILELPELDSNSQYADKLDVSISNGFLLSLAKEAICEAVNAEFHTAASSIKPSKSST